MTSCRAAIEKTGEAVSVEAAGTPLSLKMTRVRAGVST